MFNVQAVVLKQLLTIEEGTQVALALSRLRREHFTDAFSSIYVAIQNYYTTSGKIPTLDSLRMSANRNMRLSQALAVLESIEVPDVDLSQTLDVVETEFAQDLTLKLLEKDILSDLYALDKDSLIDRLNGLAMQVENEVGHNGVITNAYEIEIFKEKGAVNLAVSLGISNEFDIYSGGLLRTEVMFLGGYRGSGKSLVCSNMQVNQYEMNRVAPYFSLEMKESEVLMRNLSIMSGVSAANLRSGKLSPEAVNQLLKTRASMFKGGLEEFKAYTGKYTINEMSDGYELESKLRRDFEEVTAMPIIYDPTLNIERVNGICRSLINTHGVENVELVLLDYINQVRLAGTADHDMYDWKPQMIVAKQFKNMCGELEVAGVSPYQMDKNGEARMAKGILDSCDIAFTLNPAKMPKGNSGATRDMSVGAIMFESTKVRSMDELTIIPAINWENLRLQPSINYSRQDLLVKGLELAIDLETKPAGKKTSNKKKQNDPDPSLAGGPPSGAQDL